MISASSHVYSQLKENDILVTLQANHERSTQLYETGAFNEALQMLNLPDSDIATEWSKEAKLQLTHNYRLAKQINNRIGNFEGTINALKEAVKVLETDHFDGPELAASVMDIGIAFWRLSQYDSAITWTNQSVQIILASQSDWRKKYLQRGYLMMGLAHWSSLNLEKAVFYNKLALNTIGNDIEANARDYFLLMNNLSGVFESQEEYDSAIVFNLKGLEVLGSISEENEFRTLIPYYKAEITNNLGALYYLDGQLDQAVDVLLNALELKTAYYGEHHQNLRKTLWNLGRAFRDQGLYEQSEKYLLRGMSTGDGRSTLDSDFLLRSYNDLADLNIRANDLGKAQLYLDSARRSTPTLINGSDTLYLGLGIFETYKLSLEIIELQNKVQLEEYVEIYFDRAKKQLAFFYQHDTHYFVLNEARRFFSRLWRTYSKLYQHSKDKKFAERLWEISEINKARGLTGKSLNEFALESTVSVTDRQYEKTLQDSIGLVMDKLGDAAFDSLYLVLTDKHEKLIASFESKYPEYYQLKYADKNFSLSDATSKLEGKEVVACFFDGIDSVFAMFITPQEIFDYQYDKRQLENLTITLNEKVFEGDQQMIMEASSALSNFLFSNEFSWKDLRRIHVIPDGIVWDINFSLMQFEETPKSPPLNNTSFTYQYSGSAWLDQGKKSNQGILAMSQGKKPKTTLAQIDIFRTDSDIELPGTGIELAQIEPLVEGDYYYNEEASESRFKRQTSDNGIIHLALHGVMNNYQPERSFLKFNGVDSLNDNKLHVYEIYGLDLDASLVVLSACNSGSGKKVRGEGVLSLGRAFKAAGASSLLLSRWDVSDAVAPIIMKYFYEELREGYPKSRALHNAQKRFLETDADAISISPYYWSSFYILGDDRPVFEKRTNWLNYGLPLLLLVIVIAGIVWRKFTPQAH